MTIAARVPSMGSRLNDVGDPRSLSYRLRASRDVRLRELISEVSKRQGGRVRILDLGGSVEYWRRVGVPFLREQGARIQVLNHIASELKAHDAEDGLFEPIVGDACNLPHLGDGAFDLVHSNSVIEHVGGWSRMKAFANEVRRIAPAYYVQTPYFWFPIDPHRWKAPMIHWMPKSLQAKIMTALPVCYSGRMKSLDAAHNNLEHLVMIDRGQFKALFPDAAQHPEKLMGLTKSMVAIRSPGQTPP
jgi:hypothetical protein